MNGPVLFQSFDPAYKEPTSLEEYEAGFKSLPHVTTEAALLITALLKRQEELLAALLPFAVFGITIADVRFMGKEGEFKLADGNLYDATNAFGKDAALRASMEMCRVRKEIEDAAESVQGLTPQ